MRFPRRPVCIMSAARASAPRASHFTTTPAAPFFAMSNATAGPSTGPTTAAKSNSGVGIGLRTRVGNPSFVRGAANQAQAKKQLITLTEIDRLLTHIAHSANAGTKKSDTPMVMRAHPIPWMQAGCGAPELETASSGGNKHRQLTEAEKEALILPKHMSASYTSFDLPLASDPTLYDQYVNFSGGFRMGKLLENLDSLAGAVAYRHCLANAPAADGRAAENFHEAANQAGIYLATASADRLDMFGRLNHENVRDLKFSGFVTWTGNSSMEVFVKMEGKKLGEEGSDTLMLGRFSMVCRDAHTHKARKVPPLIVETPEEKALWLIGQEHKEMRHEFLQSSLDKMPPTSDEVADLHRFMLAVNGKDEWKGEKVVKMKDTVLQSVQLMFPQERNLHGKVFGGFLMRMAFELCFTNASIFARRPMRFLSLDQITFRLPVPIGAVVRLTSRVVRTLQPTDGAYGEAKAHIMVTAEVEDITSGTRQETNTFYFTMGLDGQTPLGRTVVPETYDEAMDFLEGERRLAIGQEMRRLYDADQVAAQEA